MKIANPNTVKVLQAPSTPEKGPVEDAVAAAKAVAQREHREAVFLGMQDLWASQLGPKDKLRVRFGANDEFVMQGKEQGKESFLDGLKKFLS